MTSCMCLIQDSPYFSAMLGQPKAAPSAPQEPPQQAQQQPIFVNPKQYHRIMARRKARARLEQQRKMLAARKV